MTLTKRSVMTGVVALTFGWLGWFGLPSAGALAAESYSTADLLAPGPLPEKVLGSAKRAGDDDRVFLAHLLALRPFPRRRLSPAQGELYRHRQGAADPPGVPLDQVAAAGAMLARCADDDKYFPLVDALFATQKGWAFTEDRYGALLRIARQAGFTKERFDACLKDQKLLSNIEAVRTRGSDKFGINSTPTFFINGEKHVGGMTLRGARPRSSIRWCNETPA